MEEETADRNSQAGSRQNSPADHRTLFISYFDLNDSLFDATLFDGPWRVMVSGSVGSLLKLTWGVVEVARNLHRRSVGASAPSQIVKQQVLRTRGCWEEGSFLLWAVKLTCLGIHLNFCEPGIGIIQRLVLLVTWPQGKGLWVGYIDTERQVYDG